MGTGTLVEKNDRDIISTNDFNQYKRALSNDLVPRNSSGAPVAEAGNLGTDTFPFEQLNVTVGHLFTGMIMHFLSYNGTVDNPGEGWMKANGDIVSASNYNAIHGANAYETFIGTSPLEGLYLPNMNDRYLIGQDTSLLNWEDGTTSIGSVGSHTQSPPNHNHVQNAHTHSLSPSRPSSFGNTGGNTVVSNTDANTSSNGFGTTSLNSSASIDIKPESIECEFWIRII